MLFPILVSALRYGLGTDYFYTYIPQFRIIANGGDSYYEFGFFWLNKIVGFFTSNGQWMIAVCSVITIGIMYRQIFRMSKNYALSILLLYLSFVYFVSLNNIRQSLAAVFLLIAIEALIDNKKIKFIILVLLASSIHRVSMIFIILIIADQLSFSACFYAMTSLAMFGVGKIIAPRLLAILTSYIPRLALYLHASELKIYSNKTIGSGYILIQFIILFLYVYFDFAEKKKTVNLSEKDEIEWKITKISQCMLLCICSFDGIIPATYRIARIFSFGQFILLPNAIYKHERNKKNRIWIYVLILIMYSFLYIQGVLSGAEEVFPYRSIFDV